jgi:hypothetical protein
MESRLSTPARLTTLAPERLDDGQVASCLEAEMLRRGSCGCG